MSRSEKNIPQEGYRQKLMEIQSLFAEDCPFICLYYRMGNVISRYMYTTCRMCVNMNFCAALKVSQYR